MTTRYAARHPTLSPEFSSWLRPRIRHVHLPDLPPLYAPRYLPGKLRDFLEKQIIEQRILRDQTTNNGDHKHGPPDTAPVQAIRRWLYTASPPPTVLSFTRRPTFVLPKALVERQEPWEAEYMRSSLKSSMRVAFPAPPDWSSKPWRPPWEMERSERDLTHLPLSHEWDPGVMVMPCAEPMYFGPGQLSLWPIIDMQDQTQRGKQFQTKFEFERILEDTTIQVLKREYGIPAFAIPGRTGVWVNSAEPPQEVAGESSFGGHPRNPRRANACRIATVHADVVNEITRFGISIHVGQPGPSGADAWKSMGNPWIPLRQQDKTTSIVAELAHRGSCPRPSDPEQEELEPRSERKSKYLVTAFDENTSGQLKAIPYSMVTDGSGLRRPAPMGMDNRDLSTAWAFEFARQLGMDKGQVDFFSANSRGSNDYYKPTNFPGGGRHVGLIARGFGPRGDIRTHLGLTTRSVETEDTETEPYEQVPVPTIKTNGEDFTSETVFKDTLATEQRDGRYNRQKPSPLAMSWPLWYDHWMRIMNRAIKGNVLDTRLGHAQYEMRQKDRTERRLQLLQDIKDPERKWLGGSLNELKKGPLADSTVRQLAKSTLEMQNILRQLDVGGEWKRKLFQSTVQMRKLLQSKIGVVRSVPWVEASHHDEIVPTEEIAEMSTRLRSRGGGEAGEDGDPSWTATLEEIVRLAEQSLSAADNKLGQYKLEDPTQKAQGASEGGQVRSTPAPNTPLEPTPKAPSSAGRRIEFTPTSAERRDILETPEARERRRARAISRALSRLGTKPSTFGPQSPPRELKPTKRELGMRRAAPAPWGRERASRQESQPHGPSSPLANFMPVTQQASPPQRKVPETEEAEFQRVEDSGRGQLRRQLYDAREASGEPVN